MKRKKRRKTRTLLLEFSYNGRLFHGLQPQPDVRTVGQVLRCWLTEHFEQAPHAFSFAARTDAGVSSEQNFVSFRLEQTERLSKLVQQFASVGPDLLAAAIGPFGIEPARGLLIHNCWLVPRSVNARNSAQSKRYTYRVLDGCALASSRQAASSLGAASSLEAASSLDSEARRWEIVPSLNHEAMASAAQYLLGTHDFSSFRAPRCSAKSPTKTLRRVEVRRVEREVWLQYEGNGFLRKMVRILSGTLLEIGAGLRSPDEIPRILAARSRAAAGLTAPARGLSLTRVQLDAPLAAELSANEAASPHSDAGHSDAGHSNAGHSDAGHSNAGHSDAGHPDAGHSNALQIRD